jgi:hypothetical protein
MIRTVFLRIEGVSPSLLWRAALALAAAILLVREGLALAAIQLPPAPDRQGVVAWRAPTAAAPFAAPAAYPSIALHPLFDPSRQAWTPPGTPAIPSNGASMASAVPPQGYLLVGLVTGLHHRSALLRDRSGKTVFLVEGQAFEGWTVRRIDAQGVHLEAANAHFDLGMAPARETAFGRR